MSNLIFLLLTPFFIGLFPDGEIVALLKGGQNRFSSDVSEIPKPILDKMEAIAGEPIALANSGGDFNSSDAIEDETLPFRRLIFAAWSKEKDEWLIYYEKGGRSHSTFLTYATLDESGEVGSIYNLSPNMKREIIIDRKVLCEKVKKGDYTIIYDNGRELKRNYLSF